MQKISKEKRSELYLKLLRGSVKFQERLQQKVEERASRPQGYKPTSPTEMLSGISNLFCSYDDSFQYDNLIEYDDGASKDGWRIIS